MHGSILTIRTCRGRVQTESGVTHLVAEHLHDVSDLLPSVGERADIFPMRHGRGDSASHPGTPDRRDRHGAGPGGPPVREVYVQNLRTGSGIKVPTRDFR